MNQKIIIGIVAIAIILIGASIYSAQTLNKSSNKVSSENMNEISAFKDNEIATTSTTSLSLGKKIESTIKSATQKITDNQQSTNLVLAPEIINPSGFINTDGQPITLQELKGKVILVNFWTYTCINCKSTLPYLNDWYSRYKDQGFEIVGVHTPEFSYEKVMSNVQNAVAKENINYPVVLDNDYSTWNAYSNHYWPRKYLINKDGYIVYDHIGEGDYDGTEKAIQNALSKAS